MGHMTAKVAVAKAIYAIDRPYDYRVPRELEGRLQPGMRVLVPFGAGNRGSDGVVLALSREGAEAITVFGFHAGARDFYDGIRIRASPGFPGKVGNRWHLSFWAAGSSGSGRTLERDKQILFAKKRIPCVCFRL